MLNGVAGFVGGDAERGYGRRVVNIAGKTKPLLCRVVMIAEVIVDFDDLDVANVGRLQNFARRLGAGDIRARPDRAPFFERAADAELRPHRDDQRDADEN